MSSTVSGRKAFLTVGRVMVIRPILASFGEGVIIWQDTSPEGRDIG
eukprot:CAMPEP_0118635454 /NCGR_PEP_ID=MMETSP0785-20121206/2086_1 /TAXON_ID=91992 /ORGANISM="Bolidomonas pacifica, Strain CCMP 1866" /LENGTH=45 /DNA_ID= /DNA_START= /DNA_END= /DNA_ORIENTATION=